jgi:ABC-type antimicrobial peptide transport system permease subunit
MEKYQDIFWGGSIYMIFKHSMKSIIRTPKKTILFLFLIMVLTVFLSIGAGMYDSARNMLKEANKTFTSIVELNYLGDISGDEVSFYSSMNSDLENFDFRKLESHPNVKAVGMENTAWAFIDGDTIKRKNLPLGNYVMVKVGDIIKYQDSLSMGIVSEVLFGRRARKNTYVMINDIDEQGNLINFNFIKDHEYLMIGKVYNNETPTVIISPGIPEPAENIPYMVDLTEEPDFLESEEGERVLELQEAMSVVENSLQVTTVSSLEATTPYFFNELFLKEGRIFDQLEYEEGHNEVILISKELADFYKVKIGDKLPLNLHYNTSGLGISNLLADYKFDHQADYEVVGIFENKEDTKYIIYMPEASWIKQDFHSTNLASFIVENGTGEKFIEDNKENLLPSMEFTLYDQGYGEAVKPIVNLKNSAVMIIFLGSLAGLAILILFSYLYVIKQKDTLKTMLSLGTGKRRTMNYILYGAVALVIGGASVGAMISSSFLNQVTKMIFESMKKNFGTDMRYSERNIGLQMNFEPQIKVDPRLPFVIIMLILLISFILLFLFTSSAMKEEKQENLRNKKKRNKVHMPSKVNVKKIRYGRVKPISLKFALISLSRSPGRSFIVPIISLILSIFIIFLGLLSGIQKEKLETVYDRIPVTAYMTTARNESRVIGGLNLQYDIYRFIDPAYEYRMDFSYSDYVENGEFKPFKAQEERNNLLARSDYIDQIHLYTTVHYEYMGISKTKSGDLNEELSILPNIRAHNNNFGYDWFLDLMNKMPRIAYADDLRHTPDFFNTSSSEVDFLDGYNYDSLLLNENIGIISRNLATKNEIQNGDTIRVTAWYGWGDSALCSVINVKVIGIYDGEWRSDTIYLPWVISYDHNYDFDYNYPNMDLKGHYSFDIEGYRSFDEELPRSVRAATFTLKNTEDLSAIRDYLDEQGYSQVGKVREKRRVIVIQDKRLVETIQNLRNHIRLIDIIKPIMLLLFGVIGFAISYLLIKHRVNEFAIMRSMGAKKRQVFLSFFLEQFILFGVGLIPALVYAFALPDKVALYGGSLLYFILSYLLGTALALTIMLRAKILDILFTKE